MSNRIAIITPGGDASGTNACIRAIVREARYYGFETFGIYRGYQGLIEGDVEQLDERSVGGIIQQGGTMLLSTRCKAIKTAGGVKTAAEELKRHGIDYLCVIGGDGSLKAASKLSRNGISVIGIPSSIDNDVYGTDETIGFDTAIDVAVEAIDKIRDTAKSFERIFIIEVMGRKHGFLALEVGVASGAEHIIVPEMRYNLNKICDELAAGKKKGKSSEIIILAEGAGKVLEIAKAIERKTGISTRASVLGYIQRGGAPSARSRTLGTLFGIYAVGLARKGLRNKVVVLKGNRITHIGLEAIRHSKTINRKLYQLNKHLAI
jgi:6-phosphofructokinase 1